MVEHSQPESQARPELTFNIGQSIDQHELYIISTLDGQVEPAGSPADSMKGGAGTVFPCLYGEHQQKRAIKFLTANNKSRAKGNDTAAFTATFEIERRVLSKLSHSNICVFHEDGEYERDGYRWRYIVTEYVDGPHFSDWLTAEDTTPSAIYEALADILEAVAHLNERHVYHCDIKLENIRLRKTTAQSRPDVVLLDYGAAQVFDEEWVAACHQGGVMPGNIEQSRKFICTKEYTHPDDIHYKNKEWSLDVLWTLARRHELHTIGILFKKLLTENEFIHVDRKLTQLLGHQGRQVLNNMISDLRGGKYKSSSEVASDFRKLHTTYLSPVGIPELSLAAEFHHSVPTATGRTVITGRLTPLISHRIVSRLHHVLQLESSYVTYPGATHTRYSHSLATLRHARYYIAHLLNDSRFRLQAEKSDLEATLLLALLHDIGHFQLSHMFEDFATDQTNHAEVSPWKDLPFQIPTDDSLFQAALGVDPTGNQPSLRGNYKNLIHEAARNLHEAARNLHELCDDPQPTGDYVTPWDLIRETFSDETAGQLLHIHNIIYSRRTLKANTVTPAQRVLAGVLSSSIDADKTAYLREDSMRTGVSYGNGVDLDGVLENLCMPTEDDLSGADPAPLIGLRRKGIPAALSVSINRNLMLSQVYWHHVNRSITAMVKHVVARLLTAQALDVSEYVSFAMFHSREECLRFLSDHFQKNFPEEINPIQALLGSGTGVYVRTCEITKDHLRSDAELINDWLLRKSIGSLTALEQELIEALKEGISIFKPMRRGELLLDVPSKERHRPAGERGGQVYVYATRQVTGRGELLEKEAQEMYSVLSTQHKQLNRVSRVFLAPKWAQHLQDDDIREHTAICLSKHLRYALEA